MKKTIKSKYDIVLIGGGASALFFLQVLKKYFPHPQQRPTCLLIEAKEQLGKKILATGNGRCNLLPLQMMEQNFFVSEKHPKALKKLKNLLQGLEKQELRKFFAEQGLLFLEEEDRLYPRSMQAASVLSFLSSDLPADILLNTEVVQVSKQQKGFELTLKHVFSKKNKEIDYAMPVSQNLLAKTVIFAGGGLASLACHTSKVEDLCAFIDEKDISPRSAALTPLECKRVFKTLSGQRWRGTLSLYEKDTCLSQETGEILFTDYGVSGISAMNLSMYVEENNKSPHYLQIDLFPEYSLKELFKILENLFKIDAEEAWLRVFSPKLFQSLYCSFFNVPQLPSPEVLFEHLKKNLFAFSKFCKQWNFEVKQVRPYPYAQITKGGLKLSALKEGVSLALEAIEDFYVIGEALDVQARCGGNNLYFAFLSAYLLANELFGGKTH